MSRIKLLDDDLANKIAAGEVVEKTMNVVKELTENSIDAKSSQIKIELVDSGIKKIQVTDDGIGMEKEDAIMAFSRHATSKIHTLEDLFNIDSLGFRGEALPSIASVSRVTLTTSTQDVATKVVIHGGTLISVEPASANKGTKIEVEDLFYNTPVRLKYLKNLYIELANIIDYVNKMALSYPNIKFTLINNDKVLLNTTGQGDLLKVINSIYGLSIAKKMIPIDTSNDDYKIYGYISYPEMTKSNRNAITTLVNGRVIKNNELNKVIQEAYHTYIPVDKYPIIVLNITSDPYLVDINIHPTKMDIKFSNFDDLKKLLSNAITSKLETLTLIPDIKIEEEINNISHFDFEQKEKKEEDIKVEDTKHDNLTFNFEINESSIDYKDDKNDIRIKKMYPVGLVHATYIIAENEDGMYIIDQHAANERINYEKYLKSMGEHNNDVTDLLIPVQISLPANEYIILKEHFDILEKLNFTVEEFGLNTILIRSHPTWLPKNALIEAIRKIIDIIVVEEDFNSYKFTEKIAITLACKMSIKANDYITHDQMEYLLDTLRETENPFTCPHGRPTIISYSIYDLEKLFKRSAE